MGPEIVLGLGISYFLMTCIMNSMPNKYSVKRIKKSGILREPLKLEEVSHLSLNECLNFGENNEIVKEFYEVLESSLGHCDLSAFYKNMQDLKILSTKDSFLFMILDGLAGTRTGGAYLSKHNKIHIDDSPFGRGSLKKSILTHELLHMASTRRDKDFTYSGFHISSKKISIGEGINEGYTELLNGRYFGVPRKSDSYFDLQMIVCGIEDIIGKDKMEKMYFSNDLNGLIEELGKYVSKDEAIELILKTDSLLKRKVRTDDKKAIELTNTIRKDVSSIKLRKLEKERDAGEISERDFRNEVYGLELYINGYVPFKKKDENGNVSSYLVSKGPLRKFEFIDVSVDDYNKYADGYYNDFLNNGLYDNNTWQNKFGLTTRKMIEAKFTSKRQEQVRMMKKRLSLDEMFEGNVSEVNPNKKK